MGVGLRWSAVLVSVVLSALVTALPADAKPQNTKGNAVQQNTLRQNVPQKTPKRRTVRLCDASEKAAVRPLWVGSKGWLFGRPDLIADLALPATVPGYLGRVATALKTKGVTPVALIVPTRGMVAYRHMNLNPALASYDLEAAVARLRELFNAAEKSRLRRARSARGSACRR